MGTKLNKVGKYLLRCSAWRGKFFKALWVAVGDYIINGNGNPDFKFYCKESPDINEKLKESFNIIKKAIDTGS